MSAMPAAYTGAAGEKRVGGVAVAVGVAAGLMGVL